MIEHKLVQKIAAKNRKHVLFNEFAPNGAIYKVCPDLYILGKDDKFTTFILPCHLQMTDAEKQAIRVHMPAILEVSPPNSTSAGWYRPLVLSFGFIPADDTDTAESILFETRFAYQYVFHDPREMCSGHENAYGKALAATVIAAVVMETEEGIRAAIEADPR